MALCSKCHRPASVVEFGVEVCESHIFALRDSRSSRYRAITAILDDPLNMACVFRELHRRGQQKFLLPPQRKRGGGWVFQSFEFSKERVRPDLLPEDSQIDSLYEIHFDQVNWFVTGGELEIGPFEAEEDALSQVILLARQEGLIFLDNMPWDNADLDEWPLKGE